MKKLVNISLWLGFIAIMIVALGFSDRQSGSLTCEEVVVSIDCDKNAAFLSEADFDTILTQEHKGMLLDSVDIPTIKEWISEIPYVLEADVYHTIDATLRVKMVLRSVLARVKSNAGDFYIGTRGELLPVSKEFVSRVPVITGEVGLENPQGKAEKFTRSRMDSLQFDQGLQNAIFFCEELKKDPVLNAMAEQVYVDKKGEICMAPKLGPSVIEMGDTEKLDSKFDRLKKFYRKAVAGMSWDEYEKISLKYKGQIVCVRKK